jgi:hypothetical protein
MDPVFKGRFTGLYRLTGKHHNGQWVFSDIEWAYLRVEDCQPVEGFALEELKTGDYWYREIVRNRKRWPWQQTTEVFIPSGESRYYAGNLHHVLLRNFRLNTDKTYFLNKGWDEASGEIYFQLEPQPKRESAPSVDPMPRQAVVEKKTVRGTNLMRAAPLPEAQAIIGPEIYASPQTGSATTGRAVPVDQSPAPRAIRTETRPGAFARFASNLFSWLILGLIAYFLWTRFPLLAKWFVGLLLLRGIIGLFRTYELLRTLASLLILCFVGYFLYQVLRLNGQGFDPLKTREGRVQVSPPKKNGKRSRGGSADYTIEKEVTWFDFSDHGYQAKFSTSERSFKASVDATIKIAEEIQADNNDPVVWITRLYDGMYQTDRVKLDSITRIFADSAARLNLDALHTAEMVVTFIQEIPYVLVHEASCAESIRNGNAFMADYHREGKPCLPNITAGVQSPYAFLHNLKGDCDTRTLLGFAILSRLGIPSSVWVSSTYGHSILGVAVPAGHGMYKEIQGVRHYGVELTSKGFRVGMVAPDHARPRNWDITLYQNPS